VIQACDEQSIFNGIQALRTLWMAIAHFVQATIRVREIASSAHGNLLKNETQKL
jgi:hypothetical protein